MSEKYCIGCGAAYGQEHATHCVKYIKPVDEVPFTYEDECKLRQEIEALKAERDRLREVFKAAKTEAKKHLPSCAFEWCELCRSVAKFEALNHKEP